MFGGNIKISFQKFSLFMVMFHVYSRRCFAFLDSQAIIRSSTPRFGLPQSRTASFSCKDAGRKSFQGKMKMSSKPLIEMKHKSVYAFDFDGVICDSEGETCISGYKAMMTFWPELAESIPAEMLAGPEWVGSRTIKWPEKPKGAPRQGMDECPDWLKTKMRKLRPIVETGYENMLLERLCIEEEMMAIRQKDALRSRPLTVSEIIANWDELRDTLIRKYGASKEELIEVFAATRDAWIDKDFEGWLGANRFYPVIDAINNCSCEKYVITTKDKRFASKLLESAGCKIDEDKIFGLGSGPKADTLDKLLEFYNSDESSEKTVIHFVEDKVETLEKICKDPRLDDVQLYFATWGYNTAAQAERAKENSRITCIDAIEFMELTSAAYTSSSSGSSE
mmetsp:Transcript_3330/g.4678  ORF Transcript_3330/g.4678 Transcript_3330/m.4678 type:complete len:393 (+) Transcript_3330:81-1259(+)